MSDEQSLGDYQSPTSQGEDSVDVTPPQSPESFDVAAFIAGVRPTRRGVRIYGGGDIVERIEELADRIDSAPEDADVDDLIDEAEALQAQFLAGSWWVVEARSQEWVDKTRKDAIEALGIDETQPNDGDAARIACRILAGQIVQPEGVTPEALERLYAIAPKEVDRLAAVSDEANRARSSSAQVVTRDFSQRRSGRRGTRRSSKR